MGDEILELLALGCILIAIACGLAAAIGLVVYVL